MVQEANVVGGAWRGLDLINPSSGPLTGEVGIEALRSVEVAEAVSEEVPIFDGA